MAVPGYEIPIHRSLTEPILRGGVPGDLAIMNATVTIALAFSFHSLIAIPFGIFFHLLALAATKKDPNFFDCLWRHLEHKDFYEV